MIQRLFLITDYYTYLQISVAYLSPTTTTLTCKIQEIGEVLDREGQLDVICTDLSQTFHIID